MSDAAKRAAEKIFPTLEVANDGRPTDEQWLSRQRLARDRASRQRKSAAAIINAEFAERTFQAEPHTEGLTDKWLILATRILGYMERDDVSDGLESEFADLRAERDELSRLNTDARRKWADDVGLLDDANEKIAELREENVFLKSFLQTHSPKMGGQHSYRFRGGWVMHQIVGPNVDDAVKHAMEAVKWEKDNAED